MLFDAPVTFTEAIKHMIAKQVLPTDLDSAALRQIDAGIRRQSFFSAQTTLDYLLDGYKDGLQGIISPKQETRVDEETGETKKVTVGYNPATARVVIKDLLRENGYAPEVGEAGTIKDLSSDQRINLVVDTQTKLAHGAGRFVQQNIGGVVNAWPGLELVRFEDKREPREWPNRWKAACGEAGDTRALAVFTRTGRMVALKSSGVWQALGDGAGGYDDTLGNPYPPFAFGSGMWTMEMDRDEAQELGLLSEGEKPRPAAFNFGSLFKLPEVTT
jgi:hypothetical protein